MLTEDLAFIIKYLQIFLKYSKFAESKLTGSEEAHRIHIMKEAIKSLHLNKPTYNHNKYLHMMCPKSDACTGVDGNLIC